MRSSFQFVPGYFLLVCALLVASIWADKAYQCTTLYDKFAKGRVYLISMLQSRMLIITKDLPPLVYEVPADKVTRDSVDMYQIRPESMDKKWPIVFNYPGYHNLAVRMFNSKTYQDSSFTIKLDKELIIFNGGSKNGQQFYLNTHTCTLDPLGIRDVKYQAGDSFDSFENDDLYISSDEPNVFYNMWAYSTTSYYLYKYVYRQNIFWTGWNVSVCQSFEQGTPTLSFYQLDSNCPQINWTIANAFVYQEHFYMFDTDQVYIFPYQTANIAGTKEIVTTMAISNYFLCIGPTTVPSLSSTSSMYLSSAPLANCSNVTFFNSTQSNTEDLLDAIPKPLEIAAITLSLFLIFVLVSICVCQVLTSEDEDQSVPNLKCSFKSRVYGPKASMN